jgi:hypothetical protein
MFANIHFIRFILKILLATAKPKFLPREAAGPQCPPVNKTAGIARHSITAPAQCAPGI